MKNKLSDLLLSFFLAIRIKKPDFILKSIPQKDGPNMINVTVEYKWFWQKSTMSDLFNGL